MKITTTDRRFIANVKRRKADPEQDLFMDPCPTEMDNHADTICFGRNFRPIHFTSEVCSVSAFLSEYEQQEDVQICTAATAFDLDSGETVILKFGQGLWFGSQMDRSLINPNQLRSFGVPVCDDPTDQYRELGIELEDGYFIPMKMNGSTCGFKSRCPTISELETCRCFLLSNEDEWNPSQVKFIASIKKGKGLMKPARNVMMTVSSTCPNLCPTTIFRDDKMVHEFDRALANEGISQGLLDERLMSSCNVNATFTSERHHGTDPSLLAKKWGIGLQKAKDTLKCTTQLNIRSAILPLTRRYRTDLLSQRLRRLSCRFYTDTAFAKFKSIIGNE